MPYSSTSDLPEDVKKALPKDAQEIFVGAFNSAYKEHGEETAFKIAWGAVKKKYHKNSDGEWVKKINEVDEALILAGMLTESVVLFNDKLTNALEKINYKLEDRTAQKSVYKKSDSREVDLRLIRLKIIDEYKPNVKVTDIRDNEFLGQVASKDFELIVPGGKMTIMWNPARPKEIVVKHK